jgi:hypothetical protein
VVVLVVVVVVHLAGAMRSGILMPKQKSMLQLLLELELCEYITFGSNRIRYELAELKSEYRRPVSYIWRHCVEIQYVGTLNIVGAVGIIPLRYAGWPGLA